MHAHMLQKASTCGAPRIKSLFCTFRAAVMTAQLLIAHAHLRQDPWVLNLQVQCLVCPTPDLAKVQGGLLQGAGKSSPSAHQDA